MSLFAEKEKKDLNYLEMTPYRIHGHSLGENGLVDVLVPRSTIKIIARLIEKRWKKPFIKANLDGLGSAVWLAIDGKRKVGAISEELTSQFGDTIQPVNDRLTMFLTHLFRNGFISFLELERK